MSGAELAARRTAAAAVLGDFRRETDRYLDSNGSTLQPDMCLWALRLSSELASVLQRLDDEAGEPSPGARLAEVRAVFAAFDWECDDRQYALEKIEAIVTGGAQ